MEGGYQGTFRRIIKEVCQVDKPLVLQLRGSKQYGSDVATSARLIVSQFADPKQNLHIYCFTGTHILMFKNGKTASLVLILVLQH